MAKERKQVSIQEIAVSNMVSIEALVRVQFQIGIKLIMMQIQRCAG